MRRVLLKICNNCGGGGWGEKLTRSRVLRCEVGFHGTPRDGDGAR